MNLLFPTLVAFALASAGADNPVNSKAGYKVTSRGDVISMGPVSVLIVRVRH